MPDERRCGVPAQTLPPCDLEWGHDGEMHANAGDGFYARDFEAEHRRRQKEKRCVAGDPAEGIDWLRERLARAEKQRDDAKRYAATWKACAKSNRVGFGWWDACTDAAWSFSGTLSRVLCERFNVRIFVEPSRDAPHGGGYFTSANDRRDEIMAAIDRIEKQRDAARAKRAEAVAVLMVLEWHLHGASGTRRCLVCGAPRTYEPPDHTADCALAKALRE